MGTRAENLFSDRPFLIYLAHLNEELLLRLYDSKTCVVAIFRMLPPMAQRCFLNLLYQPQSDWKTWVKKRYLKNAYQSLVLLFRLKIAEGHLDGKRELNLDFKMNYIGSLLSGPLEITGLRRLDPAAGDDILLKKKKVEDLLKKPVESWENVLRYLVTPNEPATVKAVSDSTRQLFRHVAFLGQHLEISKAGFHFLLLSRVEQIWTYLIYYLRFLDNGNRPDSDLFNVIEFFLKLLLCVTPHDNYESQKEECKPSPFVIDPAWPNDVQNFLVHLREIGIVYIRKRKDGFFFLTPLLYLLSASEGSTKEGGMNETSISSAPALTTNNSLSTVNKGSSKGFILVETNFKAFAYTDSSLQLAILSIFTQLLYRFQDMSVGEISRDSVRKALQSGVTAEQIVLYLKANAHSQMVSTHGQANCIPSNVVDQIFLWEEERKRLTCTPGTLYSQFDSEAEFVEWKNFAATQNILQWHSNMDRVIIVSEEGHEAIREWRNSKRRA
ncbi:transcription factor tfb2 domain-containing protein [Ditylenchus destructor]|nr:transcription factor tfb2 domain-containing protein [Ditylenchus destructor]